MKTLILLLFTFSFSFSALGIDPKNPRLNTTEMNRLYSECKDTSKPGVVPCEQAMLYEMHYNENIHKGVSYGEFIPYVGNWVDALADAEAETALFQGISFNTDTTLMNAIQSNVNMTSMGYEMSTKFNKLVQSIDSYATIMDVITRQVLLEHKIETIITQLVFELSMAGELKEFEYSGEKKVEDAK